jgi:predicted transposase/invertase (TIGR01784 family)
MIAHTINGLFGEKFNSGDVDLKIGKTATEFVKNNLDMLRADMFLKVEASQKRTFQLEFQLDPSGDMAIRVFEYGIQKALDNRREDGGVGRVKLPRAVVVHFEESGSIPDRYSLEVEFPNGTVSEYTADVLKYWAMDECELIERKLYILLPLQVFLLRAKLESAAKANDEQERQKAIADAMRATERTRDIIAGLYEENTFDMDDYDKLMLGLSEAFRHINDRYGVDPGLNMEVDEMVKTFLDKNVRKKLKKLENVEKQIKIAEEQAKNAEEQAKIEVAKKMLLKNKPMDEIVEFTGLTEDEIKNI